MSKIKLKIKYLCDSDEKRKKGLMKKKISDSECAFFIFPNRGCHGFWNKDVDYPIDVCFINDKFIIVDIFDLEATSENVKYPGNREVKYVIETNKGILESNGVEVDDQVDFDPDNFLVIIKKGLSDHNE